MSRDRDARSTKKLGCAPHNALRHHTEAKGVADRHLADEAERSRSRADLLDAEKAKLARLVQMNIEPDPPPVRQGEYGVELPARIAIDDGGIDPTDKVRTRVERRIHEINDVRASHDAPLRKGHDLDRDAALIVFASSQDLVQRGKAHFQMHVDMGSDVRRAIRDAAVEQ
jgi:hypothetical protein